MTKGIGSQCLRASTGTGEKGRAFPCGSPYPMGACPVPSLFIPPYLGLQAGTGETQRCS